MKNHLLAISVLFSLLSACTSAPTATPLPAPTATVTLLPIATAVPTATGTPIQTVPPTLTSTPVPTSTPIPLAFEFLGVPASYNSKETHWGLMDLQLWHDRIYLAHGNWAANTGPVRAMYLDLATEKFIHDEEFAFADEAIDKFRIFGDTLYAPGTDARESWDFGNLYVKQWNDKWVKLRTIPRALHVFDVAFLGKTLFVSGLTDQPVDSGVIWSSEDAGRTWKISHRFASEARNAMDLNSSLFILQDHLYAATAKDGCFVLDNNTWSSVSCIPKTNDVVSKNTIFKNTAVLVTYWSRYYNTPPRRLYFFDGQEQWFIEFSLPVYDAISTSEGLFVLISDFSSHGAILHATSLDCRCAKDFTEVVTFDLTEGKTSLPRGNNALSLEYANSRFYIGFADGRLFRSRPYKP